MAGHAPVNQKEIDTIKLLLSKGLDTSEIVSVTGRSRITVRRVARGLYDKPKEGKKDRFVELKDLMQKNLETLIKIDEFLRSEVVK